MNKCLLLLILLILIAMTFGCRKTPLEQTENQLTMQRFADDFDWNTARICVLRVISSSVRYIKVSTIDNKVIYFKGMHPGNGEVLEVTFSIPKTVKSIALNEANLNIGDGTMNINLN